MGGRLGCESLQREGAPACSLQEARPGSAGRVGTACHGPGSRSNVVWSELRRQEARIKEGCKQDIKALEAELQITD